MADGAGNPNRGKVEAHIFVCFLAYCLWVTLQHRLTALAPGLTPRQALEQLSQQFSLCGADQRPTPHNENC